MYDTVFAEIKRAIEEDSCRRDTPHPEIYNTAESIDAFIEYCKDSGCYFECGCPQPCAWFDEMRHKIEMAEAAFIFGQTEPYVLIFPPRDPTKDEDQSDDDDSASGTSDKDNASVSKEQ